MAALLVEDVIGEVDVANIDDVREAYRDKMKKKLYGLLREREKNGEWKKFLDSILIELMGYEDCNKTIDYYTLYYKLSACRYLSFEYYRKTLFECMNLFDRIDVQ
jgi:hypothetical protein|nr:MAG TPA: hypothetical protein [Caudoviricetes sp.]